VPSLYCIVFICSVSHFDQSKDGNIRIASRWNLDTIKQATKTGWWPTWTRHLLPRAVWRQEVPSTCEWGRKNANYAFVNGLTRSCAYLFTDLNHGPYRCGYTCPFFM
jgi:hypothetical protein